ncbi:MAG TPA: penicillin-binding transpeptidase domain-containing protein [Bacteroidia bacterium]|nr:penicillin-binding transpeptidase domain-containing protein [Bacteroidia bacterium]
MNPGIRQYILLGLTLLVVVLYISRLFYIQVVDDKYKLDAHNQAFLYQTDYPPRGVIYDRNGKLLVFNQVAYDLMVVPRDLKDCDTAGICGILNISKEEFLKRLAKLSGSVETARGDYRSHIFESQMLPELNARIQERLYKFNGFYVQARTVRKYPMTIAAHLMGYIGEVDERITSEDPYYKSGDYIGKSGIEKGYEDYLRGKKGVQIKMRDVHNNIKGSFKDGKYDTAAVPGLSLISTLDAELQQYGELLMTNKIGGIAAIEPATGEILALVTSPTYDPNLLVGRDFPKNYSLLVQDTLGKPLFNRALQAFYPPGSTFKLMNALIGLQEGVLSTSTYYPCAQGYPPGGGKPKCHPHPSPLALTGAIATSCNSYFSYVYRSIIDNRNYKGDHVAGYNAWRNYVLSFGVGTRVGTDLPFDAKGIVPSAAYYDKIFGKNGWRSNTVTGVGLGIGQGELSITPLQMCNIICAIANRGYYIVPHIIRTIGSDSSLAKYQQKHYTKVTSPHHYESVIEGMANVVTGGTARVARIEGIEVCGKTGTAQNPHGEDHSVFVCFAPRVNPKICVAILVENAGYGSAWAAPIASLMMEKYLTRKINRPELEQRMVEGDLLHRHPQMQNLQPKHP